MVAGLVEAKQQGCVGWRKEEVLGGEKADWGDWGGSKL